ncbi:ubiquitin conjugating enzyme E2 [Acrasis kona]|uniref:Ubiquitin conjugating enzyme E2 n=1 Tax=Acrasis kona TaxID=1008807 RepID=A0AAW2ZP03_9EUKA
MVSTQVPIAQTTQTSVTTRTTEVPVAVVAPQTATNIVNKEAVVTNVVEKPILQNVIEKQNIEVVHKPVVQEIHEQKIVEIERRPVVQNIKQENVVEHSRAEVRYEEVGTAGLLEQDRLRLAQMQVSQPVLTKQAGLTTQIREKEAVVEVVTQEIIERHVQPVITEIREQKVIREVVQPITRRIYKEPIIREISGIQERPILREVKYDRVLPADSLPVSFHQSGAIAGNTSALVGAQETEEWRTWNNSLLLAERNQGASWNRETYLRQFPEPSRYGLNGGVMSVQRPTLGAQSTIVGTQQPGLVGGIQQQGLINNQTLIGSQQQGLLNNGIQQQGLIGGAQPISQTSTLGSGITTSTTGSTVVPTERQNLTQHGAAVASTKPLNEIERENLAIHQQAVDQVVRNTVNEQSLLEQNRRL